MCQRQYDPLKLEICVSGFRLFTLTKSFRRSIMTKKILSALILAGTVGVLLSVSACNTVAGAGKDVEHAGDAIHDKAKDVQNRN
jgi:entericidin A